MYNHKRFTFIFFQLLLLIQFSSTLIRKTTKSRGKRIFHVLNEWDKYVDRFPDISSKQWELLDDLNFKLKEWNSKVNLISRKDIEYLIPSHIIPCLAMTLVKKFDEGQKVIDVGTGGGLPGLPLAICNPNSDFVLLDSNGKKMQVVEDIRKSLGLNNVQILNKRAEEYNATFDIMLGRSVSSIPKFLGFSSHLMNDNSNFKDSGLYYIKGGVFNDELRDACIHDYKITGIKTLINLETDKNILYIPSHQIKLFDNNKVNSLKP